MSLTEQEISANKQRFINIIRDNVKRDGAEKLLEYLTDKSDFFIAPASTRFHGSYDGGLAQHSLNVYDCLKDYLSRERSREQYKMNYSEETIAISALLHDICKANVYVRGTRNVKNEQGVWEQVPTYFFEDNLPYGHGEKSVYMITGFMRLTREEAFAIRYHMGFSGCEEKNNVSKAFEMFPLAFALSTADMEASYFID
ncbi:MAG: HD domain-containing protein [Eubacterium sp.]|nr:HD domain-containing protein [Eubacterium sp.]